jgi:demethylmenaquinone methyltransferase/2-methoxy-6-polyprenyl-1,4-benzoquinol methylase
MAEVDKSAATISSMFSRIAARYDLLNHLLSGNVDRRWRRVAAGALNGRHRRVLDLATGTGDLAIAVGRGDRRVVGADFCIDMLARARRKVPKRGGRIAYSAADALSLPFPDGSFDAVTVAFGLRNFADLDRGLAEIRRVLSPGGKLIVLEFSRPGGLRGALYRFYSDSLLPRVGGLVSGSPEAYAYLNRSAREWPGRVELSKTLADSGFREVSSRALTGGVVAIHEGTRP